MATNGSHTAPTGARDVLVLAYHTIELGAAPLNVSVEALRRHLELLLSRGYEGATFTAAVTSAAGRLLAVTFDDGDRSVVDHGWPVLEELGLPGTVFPAVAAIGDPGMATWDELARLAAADWEIGSHTLTHPYLPDVDEETLDRELAESRARIEAAMHRPCRAIAYPFGAADERVRDAAARAGYETGCTISGELRSDDPLLWPRVGVSGDDGLAHFRAKCSVGGRRLRASSLRPALEGLGRTARGLSAGRR